MGEYSIEIKLKYGEFTVSASTYQECMSKYSEIKEEYKNIPCEIVVYKKDQVQFVKQNKKDTIESLYKDLKNVMIKIAAHQIELCTKEEKYHQVKNKLYHELEELNLDGMSTEEQADYLQNMKGELTKRRLIEIENRKSFAFYNCYNAILAAMEDYHKKRVSREATNQTRYNNIYYTENIKVKQDKLAKLLNDL